MTLHPKVIEAAADRAYENYAEAHARRVLLAQAEHLSDVALIVFCERFFGGNWAHVFHARKEELRAAIAAALRHGVGE
jgi:hypothetical protein